jgi:hypothetical protein
MNGVIPSLLLYDFMAWKGTVLGILPFLFSYDPSLSLQTTKDLEKSFLVMVHAVGPKE